VFCVHLPAWWTRYLDSVSTARLAQIPLSLLFLELSGDTWTLFSYMSTPQTSWSGAALTGRAPDNIQVHPVQALDIQRHMPVEHVVHRDDPLHHAPSVRSVVLQQQIVMFVVPCLAAGNGMIGHIAGGVASIQASAAGAGGGGLAR
jgi:hypothetical protein